jgi:cytochrome c oxidase subunit 2
MDAHNVLVPAGSDAASVARLWWVFLVICSVVYALVIGALWLAIYRARRRNAVPAVAAAARSDARARLAVATAVAASALVLLGMLAADFIVGRSVLEEQHPPGDPVRIRVTAQQFWWQVEYDDAIPSQRVLTANELVVPVGRPIELQLRSKDVIHSFWLPALAGKKDLIPGVTNTLRFSVLRPGYYEGQCAEFCGYQHANMRTLLAAVSGEEFEAWKSRQRATGRRPDSQQEQRGQRVFETSSCVLCHAVQGSGASASIGPDLTHFGSRRRIAASPLPNNPQWLAAWITNPQKLKPGSNMPATALTEADLRDLVAYLGSLQ